MALTNTQLIALVNQIGPVTQRLDRIESALVAGQITNELGNTAALTDAQIANALATLKTVAANLNGLIQGL